MTLKVTKAANMDCIFAINNNIFYIVTEFNDHSSNHAAKQRSVTDL
jgi:hypothetical protein